MKVNSAPPRNLIAKQNPVMLACTSSMASCLLIWFKPAHLIEDDTRDVNQRRPGESQCATAVHDDRTFAGCCSMLMQQPTCSLPCYITVKYQPVHHRYMAEGFVQAADEREAGLQRSIRDAEAKHKEQVSRLDAGLARLQA